MAAMTDTPLPRRRPYRPLAARTLSRRLDLYAKISTILLGVVLAIYVGGQGWRCGRNPYCYDVMEISGAITALIGVVASFGLRGRFVELIAELVRSGAIERRVGIDNFENAVARSVVRYCLWTIIIVTAAELVAYALAGYLATPRGQIECAFSAWAGSVVGERFGRLGAYARGGNLITRSGGVVVINFWHPDNAGGLLPFSRFYFYTALLSAIPAVWLGVWWVLIPRLPQYRYDPWRLPLGFLWLIVVGIGLWGFMMPIYS